MSVQGFQYRQQGSLIQIAPDSRGRWHCRTSQGQGFGQWTWIFTPSINQGCLLQGIGTTIAVTAITLVNDVVSSERFV